MSQYLRNVFIPHAHRDEGWVARLKHLLERCGITCRNSSITSDKYNAAHNEDYIKYQILGPHIKWASVVIVYTSWDTKYSWWVGWEIEYAHKMGKRIVGVVGPNERGCELPDALIRHADAIVDWDDEHLIDAVEGGFNGYSLVGDSAAIPWLKKWGPPILFGAGLGLLAFGVVREWRRNQAQRHAADRWSTYRGPRYHDGFYWD